MNVYQLPNFPNKYYGRQSVLDEYDLHNLESSDIEQVWYYYYRDSYEGSGQIIAYGNGKWYIHDCGHCSCYGPTENFSTNAHYESLDELEQALSSEYKKEVAPLINFIREGWDNV